MSQTNTFNKMEDFTAVLGVYKVPKLLKSAESYRVLQKLAKSQPIPKNEGGLITWRRLAPYVRNTNGLLEGVTPAPMTPVYEFVTQAVGEWGAWIQVSDQVVDLFEDNILDEQIDELGKQASGMKELILWGTVSGGTQVIYANGSARTDINTPLTTDLVMEAVKVLKKNRASLITTMIKAGPNIATEPVEPGYVAVGPIDFERDVRELDGFVPASKYAQNGKMISEWELGKVNQVRFVLSPDFPPLLGAGSSTLNGMISEGGTNVDVGQLVVFGEEFFVDAPLKGYEAVKMGYEGPKMTKADPLGQRAFVSWKMKFAAARLNERWGVRIEAGFSDPFA